MKKIWGGIVLIFLIFGSILLLFIGRNHSPEIAKVVLAEPNKTNPTPESQLTRQAHMPSIVGLRAQDMLKEQKQELADKFEKKFKPALEKWCKAYEGRVPFQPEDVTFDKFHSKLGKNLYTFMIGDTTLTIQDPDGPAKVFYLMTRQAAASLNAPPLGDQPPDASIPVTRSDIIRMVQADSGVQFKPNEIIIKPTGTYSALSGGAVVDLLPEGSDPNNGLASKIDLVFGHNGKLISYQRDPFF